MTEGRGKIQKKKKNCHMKYIIFLALRSDLSGYVLCTVLCLLLAPPFTAFNNRQDLKYDALFLKALGKNMKLF